MSFWRELWAWRSEIAKFGQVAGAVLLVLSGMILRLSGGLMIASAAFLLLPLIFGSARQRFIGIVFLLFLLAVYRGGILN